MKKWSLSLGTVSGIKLFVHWTFLLLIGYIVFSSMQRGQETEDILWSIFFILTLFGCVTLHELGHALTAQRFGIQTKDIILLPIGGVARLESIPEEPREELLVTLAGPAVNLVIAALIYIGLQITGNYPSDAAWFLEVNGNSFFYMLMRINLVLAIFNMIPAFPMDGGRVLRAVLAFKFPRHLATRIAATVGQVLAVIFVLFGFFTSSFVLIFIGIFVYMGAQSEAKFVESKSFLSGYHVGDVLIREYFTLEVSQTVADAVKMLLNTQATDFLVMQEGKVVGTLNRSQIIKALAELGSDVPVVGVMNPHVKILHPSMPLEELYQGINNKVDTLMPVMHRDQLLGVLDVENVLEFIMIKEAVEKQHTS